MNLYFICSFDCWIGAAVAEYMLPFCLYGSLLKEKFIFLNSYATSATHIKQNLSIFRDGQFAQGQLQRIKNKEQQNKPRSVKLQTTMMRNLQYFRIFCQKKVFLNKANASVVAVSQHDANYIS